MSGPSRIALAELRRNRAFAKLTLDGCSWLLPHTEIGSLESTLDIDQAVQVPQGIGAIALGGEWWPIYCLSGELQLLPQIPDNWRTCVLLDNGADRFGLVCDQVEMLTATPLLLALPACMGLPDSPIQALVLLDGQLGCITTAEHLAARFAALAENTDER